MSMSMSMRMSMSMSNGSGSYVEGSEELGPESVKVDNVLQWPGKWEGHTIGLRLVDNVLVLAKCDFSLMFDRYIYLLSYF